MASGQNLLAEKSFKITLLCGESHTALASTVFHIKILKIWSLFFKHYIIIILGTKLCINNGKSLNIIRISYNVLDIFLLVFLCIYIGYCGSGFYDNIANISRIPLKC
jgi:hypothetical protein